MKTKKPKSKELAILTRLIQPRKGSWTTEVARAILSLEFDRTDKARMHELAVRNQQAILRPEEEMELDAYRRIGRFLDLLRSRARISLKPRSAAS